MRINWFYVSVTTLFLLAIAFLAITFKYPLKNNTTKAADNAKYTMRQRFGFGFASQICKLTECPHNIDTFPQYSSLGAGWYFDWGFGQRDSYTNPDNPTQVYYYGGPRPGLEYMGLTGTQFQSPNQTPATYCSWVQSAINQNPSAYPSNMWWTVGNEIGWDDQRTATQYADDFVAIKDCLKAINSTFQVGSGAIINPYQKLTGSPVYSCATSTSDSTSGYQYFNTYINRIKNVYGTNKLPDFIVTHGYTPCNGTTSSWGGANWKNITLFQNSIRLQRQQMADLGLANKDLIVKEFGPLYESQAVYQANMTDAQLKTYMETAIRFMADTQDSNTGSPDDNYLLVQRWHYFPFSGFWDPGTYANTVYNYMGLFEQFAPGTQLPPGPVTSLGTMYKDLIAQYSALPTSTPILTPTPTPIPTATSVPTPTATPTLTSIILNGNFESIYAVKKISSLKAACNTPSSVPTIPFGGTQTTANLLTKKVNSTTSTCQLGLLASKWGLTGSLNYPIRYDNVRKTDGTHVQQVIADGSSTGIYQIFTLNTTKKYLIEASIYVEKGTVSLKLTGNNSGQNLFSSQLSAKTSWQKVSLTVTNSSLFDRSTLRIISRSTNNIFYIDNVTIREI